MAQGSNVADSSNLVGAEDRNDSSCCNSASERTDAPRRGPVRRPSSHRVRQTTSPTGTNTGMMGGEPGTVASSGKPETGTDTGAGTGAAYGSGSKTTDKK